MPEIDLQAAIATNWIKLGTLEMEATGDRVIVVQDDFKFGTECTTCGARDIRMISQTEQRSVIECPDCQGTKWVHKAGSDKIMVKCVGCEARGWIICPDCSGTGTEAGLIAHPQDREQRPTTGAIVSVGERVSKFKRGDSVIYPSFAGHFWDLAAVDVNGNDVKVTIGVLREDEIIARVKGHLELRRVKRSAALHTAA
jgi:co-chaperonin GroES (HSP10)